MTFATRLKTSEKRDQSWSCLNIARHSLAIVLLVSPRPRLPRFQFASTVERLKKLEYTITKLGGQVLRGVVGVECGIGGVFQVCRNGTTQQNSVHLVVQRIRLVPREIDGQSQAMLCIPNSTHSSKVNRINVLGVLKLGSCSKGMSQYCSHCAA